MPAKPKAKREAKYVGELDDLEQVLLKALARIHKRDGVKIFQDVADQLLVSVCIAIENRASRRGLRRALDRLETHLQFKAESNRRPDRSTITG
jgi:hypothetical protein